MRWEELAYIYAHTSSRTHACNTHRAPRSTPHRPPSIPPRPRTARCSRRAPRPPAGPADNGGCRPRLCVCILLVLGWVDWGVVGWSTYTQMIPIRTCTLPAHLHIRKHILVSPATGSLRRLPSLPHAALTTSGRPPLLAVVGWGLKGCGQGVGGRGEKQGNRKVGLQSENHTSNAPEGGSVRWSPWASLAWNQRPKGPMALTMRPVREDGVGG